MVVNVIKISLRMKSKSLWSIEENIIESEKSNDLQNLKVYIELDKKL